MPEIQNSSACTTSVGQIASQLVDQEKRRKLSKASARIGGSIVAIFCALALTACTAEGNPQPSSGPSTTMTTPTSKGPIDPLSEITNSDSNRYIPGAAGALLHVEGTGPQDYPMEHPNEGFSQVQFFVSCAPESEFTVRIPTNFYSGPCELSFANTGAIPIPDGDGQVTVSIDVPADTKYWLVGIPIEG